MNLLFQDLCAVFCRQDNRISYFISKFLRSSQRHRETTQHTVTSTKFFVQKVQLFVYFHYIYKKSAVYLHHLLKLCHNVLKSFFSFFEEIALKSDGQVLRKRHLTSYEKTDDDAMQ